MFLTRRPLTLAAVLCVSAAALLLFSGGARAELEPGRWFSRLEPGIEKKKVLEILGSPSRESATASVGQTSGLQFLGFKEERISVFLRDNVVVLITFVPGSGGPLPVKIRKWPRSEARLKSAHGYAATVHFYGKQGLVAHEMDGHVVVVEIFEPMSLERYKATFYREPWKRQRERRQRK